MATATLVGNDRDLPPSSSSVVAPLTPEKEEEEEEEKEEEDEVFRKLQTDYERSRAERKREQDAAEAERQRLDEILRLCCERDLRNLRLRETRGPPPGPGPLPLPPPPQQQRQAADDRRDSRSSWGSATKIKTNGSLTSLVTHNRRSDDVGTASVVLAAEGCVMIPSEITESNAFARSQKNASNGKEMEKIAASSFALIGKNDDEYSVNPSSNRFDRSNRYIPSSSTAVNRDCLHGNGFMPVAWQSQPAEEARSKKTEDSAADREGLNRRSGGRPGGEMVVECNAVSYPHPLSNGNNRVDNNLPRKFNGHIGLDQNLKESRQKRSAEDVKERIRVLQLRILDVKNLEEKTINETQSELDLLQWEYCGLIEQLRREKDRIAAINHQQMELLLEAAKERAEAEKQIESERSRLEELEKHLEETRKRLAAPGTGPIDDVTLPGHSPPGDLVVKETEELEVRRRQFDDLEFHLLEVETRREEEREPQQRKLAAELDQLKHSCILVEETLRQLLDQKTSLVRQLKSDVIDLERERILLIEDFRKEKERLYFLLKESSLRLNTHPSQPPGNNSSTRDASRTTALELLTPPDEEETFPATPSSTTSVIQRLHDLQRQTAPDVPGQRQRSLNEEDEEEEEERTDAESLRSPDSAVSYDHLRCWFSAGVALRQDNSTSNDDDNNNNNGGSRFLSASDEEGSVLSSEDRFFDERSFGTNGGSEVFLPSSYQQNDVDAPSSSSVNRYSIRGAQSASEVSAISLTAVGDWTNGDSISHVNEGQETPEVVMRQSQRRQARPMTRYLPVRGPRDLDLRQFIESSGHRLDDDGASSHVQVTPSTCRGFLVKLGRRFRLWHRRWFVFDRRRRSVSYYSDETERRARGCILFAAIETVFVDHLRRMPRSPSPKLTFCLKTTAKTLVLMAPSAEAMRIWIDVLVTGAEGYQEFI